MYHKAVKSYMQNSRWNGTNAKAYDRYRLLSRQESWAELLAQELSAVQPGGTVLEVGSGTGFITEVLARSGFRVAACDLSPAMLARAERNLQRVGLADQVRFVQSDAESLKLANKTFSAVVSRWLLWTLPRPQLALAEMVKALAPGARLVVIDGQEQEMNCMSRWRSTLTDWVLAGRRPGWQPKAYKTISKSLPRLDAPEVASILTELGLDQVRYRRLTSREGDGKVKNWLMGNSWVSYLVTANKAP
jgi:ubiquinone/menaquinone biosynthesis C-methylase UbiE